MGVDECDMNAHCTNTNGGYYCTCASSFTDTSPDPDKPGRNCTGIIYVHYYCYLQLGR